MPGAWLFTDERLGGHDPADPLWAAARRLPRGGGILFRHYGWPQAERRALLSALCRLARARGLTVVAAAMPGFAGGAHRPRQDSQARARKGGLVTASAHSRRELLQAFARGADLVFLSPVFATASHPGEQPLGPLRFGLAARGAPGPVVALGGMTESRARRMRALGASGFAAIGHWAGKARA